jgi:hypothetical protein
MDIFASIAQPTEKPYNMDHVVYRSESQSTFPHPHPEGAPFPARDEVHPMRQELLRTPLTFRWMIEEEEIYICSSCLGLIKMDQPPKAD